MSGGAPTGIGLIGGGRWAGVLGEVLAGLVAQDAELGRLPVAVASPGNPARWEALAPARGWRQPGTIDALLADPAISHVIIARRARDHASTTLAALAAGKAVLVEKPFALTLADCARVVRAAKGRACVAGLVFAHAGNLARFAAACTARGGITGLHLDWQDPATEIRHGAAKTADPALNVVQDVMPHLCSVFRHVVPAATPLHLRDVDARHGGAEVALSLRAGDMTLDAVASRVGGARRRRLVVRGQDWTGWIDFAREPGTAEIDGFPFDTATGFTRPLGAQIAAFLAGRSPLPQTRIAAAAEAIGLGLDALASVRHQQARLLRAAGADDPATAYALREVMLGGIRGDGTGARLDAVAGWAGLAPQGLGDAMSALPSGMAGFTGP